MIVLQDTAEKITLSTSNSNVITYYVTYSVFSSVNGYTTVNTVGTIAGAGSTDILPAPATDEIITVLHIMVINTGGAANTVGINRNVSGTDYSIINGNSLAVNESIAYNPNGWASFDALGVRYQSTTTAISGGGGGAGSGEELDMGDRMTGNVLHDLGSRI